MEEHSVESVERKPRLTIDQQIAHLKTKGVTFNACSEADAMEFLSRNNYYRTASYRKLYERRADGPQPGTYIGLDFADLISLSRIDRRLREVLLLAAIDVEHFSRERLLTAAAERDEDGYGVVSDFYASLNLSTRNRLIGGLNARGSEGERHDNYTGDIVARYGAEKLPLWAALEVMDFGTFTTMYKFCAERWDNERMRQEHYVLRSVRALRNAVAHNSCIINGLTKEGELAGYKTNALVSDAMNAAGIKNTKTRRAKMRNLRIAQIAATLWALAEFCPQESCLPRHAARFHEFRLATEEIGILDHAHDGIVSFFVFLFKLVDIWVPTRA